MKYTKLLNKSLSLKTGTTTLTIIFLAILLTGALISYSIANSIPQAIDKQKNASLNARLIFVSPDDLTWDENELMQLAQRDHVELILSQNQTYWGNTFETDFGQASLEFLGATGSMLPPKIIFGKQEELEKYEVLVPSIITLKNGQRCKGENFIEHGLSITIPSPHYMDANTIDPSKTTYQTVNFEIVGIYDETAQVYLKNQLFTSIDTIESLYAMSNGNRYDFQEPNQTMRLIIDNYKNAQKLEMQLNANGYSASSLSFDYVLLYTVQLGATTICIITVLLSCIIIFFLLRRNIFKNYTNIGLLKVVGYDDPQILKIIAKQSITFFISALCIAILAYSLIYPIMNTALFSVIYLPVFSIYFILGLMVYLLIIPSINIVLLYRQLKRISPIEMLRDEN